MTNTIHYPERDLHEDEDLEAFFLMRTQGMNETTARDYITIKEMNEDIQEYLMEMAGERLNRYNTLE